MNEKPVERLNYFNGQRLQAADFKLEQDYHMRVRRWLNRSLYTPGIASGLEVYKIENSLKVKILPGLAIDHLGREIILLEEQNFTVAGHGNGNGNSNGACKGPYLTIRYQEEVVAQQDLCCAVGGDSGNKAPWGGPARILAEPVLRLNADLPHESSGKIALACLTLAPGCESVERVDTGVRRYTGPASAAKVRQYALEGEREVAFIPKGSFPTPPAEDVRVVGRIYFHIRGRQPSAVTLYLRGEQFSPLHYTELGRHNHTTSASGFSVTIPEHGHALAQIDGNAGTGLGGKHTPSYRDIRAQISGVLTDPAPWGISPLIPDPSKREASLKVWAGMRIDFDGVEDHWHAIPSETNLDPAKTILLSGGGSSSDAGVLDVAARDDEPFKIQKALTYVDNLKIAIDGIDVTENIRKQVINNRPPDEDWSKFGGDTVLVPAADHVFVTKGTGAIRIDYLPGVILNEGEHYIDLSVTGDANGGRIHFNLYVE